MVVFQCFSVSGCHAALSKWNVIFSALKSATGSWLQGVQPTFSNPALLSSMVMRRWMAACLQAGEADVPCSCGLLRMRHARFFPSLRLPPEGLVLKWQRGGDDGGGEPDILWRCRKDEERRRRRRCDLGAEEIMWCVVLHSFVSVIEQCRPSVLPSARLNCIDVCHCGNEKPRLSIVYKISTFFPGKYGSYLNAQ